MVLKVIYELSIIGIDYLLLDNNYLLYNALTCITRYYLDVIQDVI